MAVLWSEGFDAYGPLMPLIPLATKGKTMPTKLHELQSDLLDAREGLRALDLMDTAQLGPWTFTIEHPHRNASRQLDMAFKEALLSVPTIFEVVKAKLVAKEAELGRALLAEAVAVASPKTAEEVADLAENPWGKGKPSFGFGDPVSRWQPDENVPGQFVRTIRQPVPDLPPEFAEVGEDKEAAPVHIIGEPDDPKPAPAGLINGRPACGTCNRHLDVLNAPAGAKTFGDYHTLCDRPARECPGRREEGGYTYFDEVP